jgi:DNA polymerase-3 subunit delta
MARAVKKEKPSGAKELREDIRQKHFRRVYLLYGEEEYLVRQYRQELIKAVCGEEDSMNLNIHRDDHLDWSTIQDEILSMPFFAQYRMVVLDDTKLFLSGRKTDSGAKEEAEEAGDAIGDMSDSAEERNGSDDAGLSAAIASFLPRIPETTVVLFTERPDEKKPGGQKGKSSVDRRGKLFKSVAKCGLAAEFSTPDEQELRKWVLGKLGAEKIRITQETLNVFFSMTGTDMSHIHTETQKLINKMNVLDDGWKKDRPSFIEAYDDKGGIHMVNTMYVIEVYVVEHVLIKGVDQILEGVDFE